MSDFISNVSCAIATGDMILNGSGGHMWNIVTMGNGKNYIVDVTNCDEGTIGASDKLFMVGYSTHPDSKSALKATLGGLKKGKAYYVRIRAVAKNRSGTCYSAWSSTKKIKK